MRKHKEMIVFFVGIAVVIGGYLGGERNGPFPRSERSDIKYSDMIYTHIDSKEVDDLFDEKKWGNREIGESQFWDDEFWKLYTKLCTMSQLANIKYTMKDTTKDYWEEYNYNEELLLKMENAYNQLFNDAYNEEESTIGDQLYMEMLDLESSYDMLEEAVVTEDGYSLSDLLDMYADLDEIDEIDEHYGKWLDSYKQEAGEILLTMAKNQREQAELYGYDSALDMINDQYLREYTKEEIDQYCAYVKQNVPAIYNELLEYNATLEIPNSIYKFDEEQMFNKLQKEIKRLSPSFRRAFDYMRKYELCQICYDEAYENDNEAYTWYIEEYHEPVIYISGTDETVIYNSIAHEFGHFYSEFLVEDPSFDNDLAETYSQGMEVLLVEQADKVLDSKESAELVKIDTIRGLLGAVLEGCLYNEFLEEIYADPDITVADIDEIFDRLLDEYGLSDQNYYWEDVRHNFVTPFYYFSYSISAVPSLEIWGKARENEKEAVKLYLNLVGEPNSNGYIYNITQAGLGDPFAEETLDQILESICKEYNLEKKVA